MLLQKPSRQKGSILFAADIQVIMLNQGVMACHIFTQKYVCMFAQL